MSLDTRVALLSFDIIETIALAGFNVTKVVLGTTVITIAWLASVWTKAPRAWCTSIAFASDYVWFALTSATMLVAHQAERASWITVAS